MEIALNQIYNANGTELDSMKHAETQLMISEASLDLTMLSVRQLNKFSVLDIIEFKRNMSCKRSKINCIC